MRHRKKNLKLGRAKGHRESMIANLTSSLVLNEYIVTSLAKAQACKAYTDRVISIAKKKDDFSKRRVKSLLRNNLAAEKIDEVLISRFDDREGGFVRITKLGRRKGDNSKMAKLYFVGSEPFRKKKVVKKGKKKKEVKEKGGKEKKGKGIIDRVKGFRIDRKGKEKVKDDQVSNQTKGIDTKSRSGI